MNNLFDLAALFIAQRWFLDNLRKEDYPRDDFRVISRRARAHADRTLSYVHISRKMAAFLFCASHWTRSVGRCAASVATGEARKYIRCATEIMIARENVSESVRWNSTTSDTKRVRSKSRRFPKEKEGSWRVAIFGDEATRFSWCSWWSCLLHAFIFG